MRFEIWKIVNNVGMTLPDDPNHMCQHILPIMERRLNSPSRRHAHLLSSNLSDIQFRTAEMTEITLMSFCRQIILDQIVLQKSDIVTPLRESWPWRTILEKPEQKPQKSALFRLRKHFSSNNKRVECSFTLLYSLSYSFHHCPLCLNFFLESIQDLYSKAHFNMTLTSVFHFKARAICQISQLNEE